MGEWSIAPLILNLCTRWYEKLASHSSRFDPGKKPLVPTGYEVIWDRESACRCDKSVAYVVNRLVI
jgi:hypothetical protein